MANILDLPRNEADVIIALNKLCPEAMFNMTGHGKQSYWLMAAGLIIDGEYKRALTLEICCRESPKPRRTGYKFTIFKSELGAPRRVYQLDVYLPPICELGDHDWPHEHLGQDRVNFSNDFPKTFDECVAYFCKKTTMEFEISLESPLNFSLR